MPSIGERPKEVREEGRIGHLASRAGSPGPPPHSTTRRERAPPRNTEAVIATGGIPRPRELPTRGRPIQVVANHLAVQIASRGIAYHYDVIMDPEPRIGAYRDIWASWQRDHGRFAGAELFVYDGRRNAYSLRPLDQESVSFKVDLPSSRPARPGGRPPPQVTMTFTLVAKVDLAILDGFLRGKNQVNNETIKALTVVECVFNHYPAQRFVVSGRSSYEPPNGRPFSLGGGLDLWVGMFGSARPGQGMLTYNVDTSYTAFYQPAPVIDLVAELLQRHPRDLERQELDPRQMAMVSRAIKGLRVQIMHLPGQPIKKVGSISTEGARRLMFEFQPRTKGTDKEANPPPSELISVADYFHRTYQRTLQYPQMPCIGVGPSSRVHWFPFEVCKLVQGQKYRGKLSERQTSATIKEAAKRPPDRLRKIKELISRHIGVDQLASWGIQVGREPMRIQARLLPTPNLLYGRPVQPRDGVWNLRDIPLLEGITIQSMGVLNLSAGSRMGVSDRDIHNFFNMFFDLCGRSGLRVNPEVRSKCPIHGFRQGQSISQALDRLYEEIGRCFGNPNLIFIVLPDKSSGRYNEIKSIAETRMGVVTQCMQAEKVRRPNPQYCANVILKVNKKGGRGFNVKLADPIPYLDVPAMVVGVDVSHPGPGSNQPSIAAVVGTLDRHLARYTTECRTQAKGVEEVAEIQDMFTAVLMRFMKNNGGRSPQRILIYRDGVSEGQFARVRDLELAGIQRACEAMGMGSSSGSMPKPQVTLIVVQKRHHTRFFAQQRQDEDRSGNISPGLVVDQQVVHPTHFDFFVQSQAGLQGTSRPARYSVLHDEFGFTPDALYTLTYGLCYLFARCTRSVSVATPAYYAHQACFRASAYFRDDDGGSECSYGRGSSGADLPAMDAPRLHPRLVDAMVFM